ncbi:DUF2142 domain-containing protein [Candidatus Gottesmanbacteria bacterium]|nr:DUF2142 domain-containing protein [Candidatus Gottesmanbacteria bacterium]
MRIKLLLIAVFLNQLAWLTFVPLWQTPDEQAHFGEVALYAETGGPKKIGNNLNKEIWLTEKILGTDRDEFGNNKFTYHPEYKTPYSSVAEQEVINLSVDSRTEFIKKEATGYPPLYYFLTGIVYKFFYNNSLFDRVFAVRIFTVLTLVALAGVAYLIGGEVLAILVGFMPMLSFVHAGVTSDALFNLLVALFILFCLKRRWVFIILIFILAYFTKPQVYILSFIVLPLLWRNKKLILIFVLLFLPLIKFIHLDRILIPETTGLKFSDLFSSSFVDYLKFTFNHTYQEVLPWFWGVFRWLSLGLPEVLRKITNWLTIISFIGFGVYLIKHRNKKILFMAYAAVVYFLAITLFDFAFWQTHGYSFGIQGRYFFPVIIPFMVIFLVGLKPLGRLLPVGMIIFNIITFFWVMLSYYSIDEFFLQASQYKPLWLKFPTNLIILGLYLICSLLSLLFIMRKKSLKVL